MTDLIPRRLLVGNPTRISPRLSPDGERIAWLAPQDGVLNVWVAPRSKLGSARCITSDDQRGIRSLFWAWDGRHVLFVQDAKGDENWHLYAVNIETAKVRDLTPFDGVQAQVVKMSHKHPDRVLVGLNRRDPRLHDLYHLSLTSGELDLVCENEGAIGHVADQDLNVRLRIRMQADGSELVEQRHGDSWAVAFSVPNDDSLTTGPIGFAPDGRLYLLDSRDRDTAGLYSLDLTSGERQLLAADARADISAAWVHPTSQRVQLAEFTYERQRHVVLDDSIRDDLAALRDLDRGEIELVSRSLADDHWLVAYVSDTRSTLYYHWDRTEKRGTFLFSARPELDEQPLAPMHPVVFESRDGLPLVSYLTLPVDADAQGSGRPNEPLPMVLLVHGGPWHRDTWGVHPEHQLLANRGYAVLSVNFRGSTGFGKRFINAANLQWSKTMHDDLLDAVEWAVEQGIAQRDKIAIMGGSYGGYAALVGLAFTPDVFAAGVDIVGPSNLETLIDTIPPYWQPAVKMFHTRVGDPTTEAGKAHLQACSPLFHCENIRKPLLIAQGANDPRVKQSEADQIVEGLKEKGIPVIYALYPDEGHGFARPENRLSFYALTEHFLAEVLGGRTEPIGEALNGASLQLLEGADRIAGL